MKISAAAYSIIGVLAGFVLAVVFVTFAVSTNHRGMMNVMGIDGSRMMGGDIDRRFIEHMIPHHEGAIVMAERATTLAQHEEIRTLAKSIITSQSAENDSMRRYYKEWFGVDVPTVSGSGMWGGHMIGGQPSSINLESVDDFDKAFLTEMIAHHRMGVMMARMLTSATNRPEMKELGGQMIADQSREIDEMQSWYRQWGYSAAGGN